MKDEFGIRTETPQKLNSADGADFKVVNLHGLSQILRVCLRLLSFFTWASTRKISEVRSFNQLKADVVRRTEILKADFLDGIQIPIGVSKKSIEALKLNSLHAVSPRQTRHSGQAPQFTSPLPTLNSEALQPHAHRFD
jgi:hypothetical protein